MSDHFQPGETITIVSREHIVVCMVQASDKSDGTCCQKASDGTVKPSPEAGASRGVCECEGTGKCGKGEIVVALDRADAMLTLTLRILSTRPRDFNAQ